MCGIVGYIGTRNAVPILLEGLRRLEYRGYDSAGLAVLSETGNLTVCRTPGKLRVLEQAIRIQPIAGAYGIGHTRWATHGRPTETNAHPHRDCTGEIAVVHNGIVENYSKLKHELETEGHVFVTETDTEVIAHLIEKYFHGDLEKALCEAVRQLEGIFAIAAIAQQDPGKIVLACSGPPAVIGVGQGEYFVASDVPAILNHTRDVYLLADGDLAVITAAGVHFTDFTGRARQTGNDPNSLGSHDGGKGRLPALYAQGNLRAAARRAGNDLRACRSRFWSNSASHRCNQRGNVPAVSIGTHRGLRYELACGPGG